MTYNVEEECDRLRAELSKAVGLRDQLIAHHQEARRQVSRIPDLKQKLKFKKKEMKLTKQKIQSLVKNVSEYEGLFGELRKVMQNGL